MYLYKKTHNITNLKYLGFTRQDPFKYKGSGKRWKHHIKKYGYDVTTEILLETNDVQQIKEKGLYYSNLWDVSNSKEWANLKPEEADGGGKCFNHEANKINSSKGGIARAKLIAEGKYDPSPWNKGLKLGSEPETTKMKKSASHKGMKRSYRLDGTWFWIKPH